LILVEHLNALAQAAPVPLDGVTMVRVLSRALHILGAVILGGGLFYLRTILSPSGAEACFAGRRVVWARWVALATFLLLASGIYNFIVINSQAKVAGAPLGPTYHALFGIKMLLGFLVMFIAAILAGRTPLAERARAKLGFWLNVGWVSVMAIIILGAMLRTMH
jgi:hypothetical protein